ncbi:hypothetical protein M1O50_05150, partial [Dehalococcoidia bacterium]|nr:hypothetical protein [Dehalococcoidia bacterium]
MVPIEREENFVYNDFQPVGKPRLAPPFANSPDSIFYLAEAALNSIGIQWNPEFISKPELKEGGNSFGKILDICPGCRILLFRESIKQLFKAL